jgi:hypothetical protein
VKTASQSCFIRKGASYASWPSSVRQNPLDGRVRSRASETINGNRRSTTTDFHASAPQLLVRAVTPAIRLPAAK